MVDEVFNGKLLISDIKSLCDNYLEMEQKIIKYKGTNIRAANIILNSILSEIEQLCLEEIFFGNNGWYRRTNAKECI